MQLVKLENSSLKRPTAPQVHVRFWTLTWPSHKCFRGKQLEKMDHIWQPGSFKLETSKPET